MANYPISFLPTWILQCLLENVPSRSQYTNPCIGKNTINHDKGKWSIKSTPLVRIMSISNVTPDGEVIMLLNDSTHTIAAVFTREAVIKFEQEHSQRITYETIHRLVVLRRADIYAMTPQRGQFDRVLAGLSRQISDGRALLYFRVMEVEIFLREKQSVPISADNMLRSVYVDGEYLEKYGRKEIPEFDDSDGFVIDSEEVKDTSWISNDSDFGIEP